MFSERLQISSEFLHLSFPFLNTIQIIDVLAYYTYYTCNILHALYVLEIIPTGGEINVLTWKFEMHPTRD